MGEAFPGTERFQIRRRLGSGGMGVVYQAHDKVRCVDVALKTLREVEASAIYRFKREFRALADVSHPNLVTLHELFSEGDRWFFTMELVQGIDFVSHVREAGAFAESKSYGDLLETMMTSPARAASDVPDDDPTVSELTETEAWQHPSSVVNLRRLRRALPQLIDGLCALHRAGSLHRDVKPSNILIEDSGRVVLLDFGLVSDVVSEGERSITQDGALSGTPAYMAPEQAKNERLGEAADWYSVGVVLYESLTGRLPFPGKGLEMLAKKMTDTPLIPSTIAPATPIDLNVLCMELLSRPPEDRPNGEQILRRVRPRGRAKSSLRPIPPPPPTQTAVFVGREPEITRLHEAYLDVDRGQPVTVFVRGSAGMGKTALVRRFLREISARHNALVLSGRCYERESVPFKAVDSVIDQLSRFLAGLDQMEAQAILPRDVRALTKVFPVLERVEAIAEAPTRRADITDKPELRRRAFKALKDLLGRIGDRHPVVLHVDDLQWGDADSAALLMNLMRPPEPPAVLLIGSYRREDEADSPLVREFLAPRPDDATRSLQLRRPVLVTVDPLSQDEGVELATALLPGKPEAVVSRAQSIAVESGGSPFLVESLAHHASREGGERDTEPSLECAIEARVALLSLTERRLLEIVSVAARPVPVAIAYRAAGIAGAKEEATLGALITAKLVRATAGAAERTVEAYHDRIRETVVGELDGDTCAGRHRSLALTLEILAPGDAHALFVHFHGAGDAASAASYAVVAGDEATRGLAFDRAAFLYRTAMELRPDGPPEERRALLIKLGDALANAARGTDAAQAYVRAAADSPAVEALDLERRAAEQFLINGHVGSGRRLVRSVLAKIGIELAPTPEHAWEAVMASKAKLLARGVDFEERDIAGIPQTELAKIDVLGSVSVGLMLADTVRGADFQLRHVLLALDTGEPVRIARALALEACYVALTGGSSRERTTALTRAAARQAQRLREPRAIGTCALAIGMGAWLMGDWARARRQLEGTERLLRDSCTGVAWELATARIGLLNALYYLGELRELTRRVPAIVEDAEARGDLYTGFATQLGNPIVFWLIEDEPDQARKVIDGFAGSWSSDEFIMQHEQALRARCEVDLYTGRGSVAYARLAEAWPSFVASRLSETQLLRIAGLFLRARAALATARASGHRDALLDAATRDAETLDGEGMDWSKAYARLVEGLVASGRDDAEGAQQSLEAAVVAFEKAGMAMHAAAARWRLGARTGGERGDNLRAGAKHWMIGQGVRNPTCMFDMLAPDPSA